MEIKITVNCNMKFLLLILLLVILLFLYVTKQPVSPTGVSGTGPGYIPAFQGHPSVGVSGL
jgi:hypothetical protein